MTSAVFGQQNYDWVRPVSGRIPRDAVVGGTETNGRTTYICRARYGDRYYSGKALDDRCYYNPGSGERSVRRFEVLVGGGLKWRRTSNYDRAIIVGGNSYENYYVCRVTEKVGEFPGRLEDGRCYYTKNNRGYSRRRYELLVSRHYTNTLLSSATRGDYRAVRDALRDGQAINQKNSSGETALMLASENGYTEVVRELLYERAVVDIRDKKGNTALILAAWKGHSRIVRQLLSDGASIEARNDNGDNAFTMAASGGHAQLVRSFMTDLTFGADSRDAQRGFRNAAYYGHTDVLMVFLDEGVDIESSDANGRTALMQAAAGRKPNAVNLLLTREANVNARDNNGFTPFLHAVNSDSNKVLRVFMEERVLVKTTDYEAQQGMRIAARNNRRRSMKYLMARGIDINSRNSVNGTSALMESARQGHKKATEMLVKARANLNLQNNRGETALMLAAANSKNNTTKVLIKAKAGMNLRDKNGITALGWAVQNKHKDTRKTLQKAGGKQ